jgi:hypothetical protein
MRQWRHPSETGLLVHFYTGLLAVLIVAGAPASAAADPPRTIQAAETVQLVIDYNDGAQKRFTAIPWHEGMTVFDALKFAQAHPHGIKVQTTGQGATLFVTSIDGLANQGGGEQDKNWVFSVNGKKGNKSCAVSPLKPSDVALWKFDTAKL